MTEVSKDYPLEKKIWTEADFEIMGWHDSPIYGMTWSNSTSGSADLIFDIDYIFEWIHPEPPDTYFSFWIAPATLIFKDTYNVKIDVGAAYERISDMEIADINRLDEVPYEGGIISWKWEIALQNGTITFESRGYDQIIKGNPVNTTKQCVPPELRGEVNFSRHHF